MKRRIFSYVLITIMIAIGTATYPATQVFTREWWQWLTLLLGGTIVVANVFGEEQYQLFDHITKENFSKAPIFGILSIPFVVSLVVTTYMKIKQYILY